MKFKFLKIDTIIIILIVLICFLILFNNLKKKTDNNNEIKIDNILIEKYHKKKKIKKIFKFNQIWNFLDYTKIFNYDDFKTEFYKYPFPNNELREWGDKIWLIKWFKKNNIKGPNYINYTKLDKNIIKNIKLNSYCVKVSHLSERIGVIIVKNNRLLRDVEYELIKDVPVPSFIKKLKKNYKISHEEIYRAMLFFKKIRAKWSPNNFLSIKPGYIVEKLRDDTEIKVFVMLGKVVGYYYMSVINIKFNLYKVFQLAEKTAIVSGVDFVRIDIIFDNNEYRVSEFTINPAVWGKGEKIVKNNFHKILKFHHDNIKKDRILLNKYHKQKIPRKFIFNQKWKYLNYDNIFNFDDYKFQMMNHKFSNSRLNIWKDKIWLIKWYKKNNITGPNYINYTRKNINIISNLKLNSYCVKPTHLSERIGVFVIKNNILIKDVEHKLIRNVKVPSYFKKFKKGYRISNKEVYKSMLFLKKVRATWEQKLFMQVKPGYIIEKLRDYSEIKVFVMLGNVIGYYYMIGSKENFDLFTVFELAERTAIKSGIDFVRVDIVYSENKYRISEFTFNPSVWGKSRRILKNNINKLINFHRKKKY